MAGESFTLACTVTLSEGDTGPPTIEWISSNGDFSGDTDITQGAVTEDGVNPSMYTRTLDFNLRTSHGGGYTCRATSSAVTGMDTETLIVQSTLTSLLITALLQQLRAYMLIVILILIIFLKDFTLCISKV